MSQFKEFDSYNTEWFFFDRFVDEIPKNAMGKINKKDLVYKAFGPQ